MSDNNFGLLSSARSSSMATIGGTEPSSPAGDRSPPPGPAPSPPPPGKRLTRTSSLRVAHAPIHPAPTGHVRFASHSPPPGNAAAVTNEVPRTRARHEKEAAHNDDNVADDADEGGQILPKETSMGSTGTTGGSQSLGFRGWRFLRRWGTNWGKPLPRKKRFSISPFKKFVEYGRFPVKFTCSVTIVVLLFVHVFVYQLPEAIATETQRQLLTTLFMPAGYLAPGTNYVNSPTTTFALLDNGNLLAFFATLAQTYFSLEATLVPPFNFLARATTGGSGDDVGASRKGARDHGLRDGAPLGGKAKGSAAQPHAATTLERLRETATVVTGATLDEVTEAGVGLPSVPFPSSPVGARKKTPTSTTKLTTTMLHDDIFVGNASTKPFSWRVVVPPLMRARLRLRSPRNSGAPSESIWRTAWMTLDSPLGLFAAAANGGVPGLGDMAPLYRVACAPRQSGAANTDGRFFAPCRPDAPWRGLFDAVQFLTVTLHVRLVTYDSDADSRDTHIWTVEHSFVFDQSNGLATMTVSVTDRVRRALNGAPFERVVAFFLLFVSFLDFVLRVRSAHRVWVHRARIKAKIVRRREREARERQRREREEALRRKVRKDGAPRSPLQTALPEQSHFQQETVSAARFRTGSGFGVACVAGSVQPKEQVTTSSSSSSSSSDSDHPPNTAVSAGAVTPERSTAMAGAGTGSGSTFDGNGADVSPANNSFLIRAHREEQDRTLEKAWRGHLRSEIGFGWLIFGFACDATTLAFATMHLVQLFSVTAPSSFVYWRSIVLGVASLLSCAQLVSYMRYFPKLYFLITATATAVPHLLNFLASVIPIFFGFACYAVIVFGAHAPQYATITESATALYSSLFGDSLLQSFQEAGNTANALVLLVSRLFCFCFISLFMFAVLNIALAIVVDSYVHIRGQFSLFGTTASRFTELESDGILLQRSRRVIQESTVKDILENLELLKTMSRSSLQRGLSSPTLWAGGSPARGGQGPRLSPTTRPRASTMDTESESIVLSGEYGS